MFGAISLMRLNDVSISGQAIQQAFEKFNPGFKLKAPKVFECMGKLKVMRNSAGIIIINTEDKKSVVLDNRIRSPTAPD